MSRLMFSLTGWKCLNHCIHYAFQCYTPRCRAARMGTNSVVRIFQKPILDIDSFFNIRPIFLSSFTNPLAVSSCLFIGLSPHSSWQLMGFYLFIQNHPIGNNNPYHPFTQPFLSRLRLILEGAQPCKRWTSSFDRGESANLKVYHSDLQPLIIGKPLISSQPLWIVRDFSRPQGSKAIP